MKKYIKLLLVLALFLITPNVSAKEVEHFTSKVDNDITINQTYNSTVATAGESITFDGTIKGLGIGAGNKITQNGINDYTILAGNTIEINGTTNNDAIIAGNIITLNDTAEINRDIIIAGSDIEINGTFHRNVSIYASKITFNNANVQGNVKLYSTNVKVSKDTSIAGNLSYPEDCQYTQEKGATIGKVIKTEAVQTEDDDNFFATVSSKIWSFLCLTLTFAVISLIFPAIFTKINDKFEKMEFGEVVEVFTKGLVALILIPVIIILLCCTIIGIPLGIIIALLYGISIYVTTIFAAYLLGYKIWQKTFKKEAHILLIGLLGLFILFICNLIPGVRLLVSIITTLIGLGLIVEVAKPKKQ